MATKPGANAKLNIDELASQYGYSAAFFNSDGELKALITQAVKEQWSSDKFKAKLLATNWYRNHNATWRSWTELSSRDPQEANRQMDLRQTEITQMASQMGMDLPWGRLHQMAWDSLAGGWDNRLLQQAVASEFHYTPGGTGGQAATIETQMRGLANDYGVTVSDSEMGNYIGGVLSGKFTQDNYSDYIRDLARSKYAGMKGYIDMGLTVKQVAAPYVQSYAQLLEQNGDAVTLNDPLLQKALQGTPDPKTGLPVMQSLYQFEQSVRQDKRWLGTKNARDQAESSAMQVLRDWGIHA